MSVSTDSPACVHCVLTEPFPRSTRVSELLLQGNPETSFYDEDERQSFLNSRQNLKQESEDIEVQLQNLLKRRATVAQDLDDLAVLFGPIQRIPNEIWQEIFVVARDARAEKPRYPSAPMFVLDSISVITRFAVEGDLDNLHTTTTCPDAPWNVSQVCRLWRSTALGYPYLWSFVGIEAYGHPKQGKLMLWDLQTERATGQGLRVSLVATVNRPDTDALSAIMAILLRSVSRWKHLQYHLNWHMTSALFTSLGPMMTSLQSLDLQSSSFRSPYRTPLTIFSTVSSLTAVAGEAYDMSAIKLPWNQLQRVLFTHSKDIPQSLMGMYLTEIERQLFAVWSNASSVAQIQNLTLDDPVLGVIFASWDKGSIFMPSLTRLSVKHRSRSFLAHLEAPSLTSVTVDEDQWREFEEPGLSEIVKFLNRSAYQSLELITECNQVESYRRETNAIAQHGAGYIRYIITKVLEAIYNLLLEIRQIQEAFSIFCLLSVKGG